ncbi:hypothetical protein MYX75_12150 [Acidobacteria bacterium AH-259-A15]|nr:hypothetical protein [Acidobacteria bacterium AH-259-A15]
MPDLETIDRKLKERLDRLEEQRAALDLKQAEMEEQMQAVELVTKIWEGLAENEEGRQALELEVSPRESPPEKREEEQGPPSEDDAILEVIRTFHKPLPTRKIVEELVAVGYPFNGVPPEDAVSAALQRMMDYGRVRKVDSFKGTLFELSQG